MTIKYIECYDLRECPYRSTWKRHTEQRAILASKLAECYACEKTLRKCSKSLWRAYRRLEDYAKCTHLVDTRTKTGYGKLCEYTLYLYYESSKPSWTRHVEVRVVYPVPLHVPCKETMDDAEFYATYVAEALYQDIPWEKQKDGIRELKGDYDYGEWCNGSARAPLTETIVFEVFDYRGYNYRAWMDNGWCSWRLRDPSLINIEL